MTSDDPKRAPSSTSSVERDCAEDESEALFASMAPEDCEGPIWISHYRLLEVVGHGGFGVVWLAERRTPMVQRVAIKIIKTGMDSESVVARFEQERQALAMMAHPYVAKVFDGGVTPLQLGGQPYFVMEYVAGLPITAYCDHHRLTIRQRLSLFSRVCEGVQHAHSKGIIHRDLKPSNVLVTASGEAGADPIPKIIDFGVAKALHGMLTDRTIHTGQHGIVGTYEYMSPEQASAHRGSSDTRSDVYALGVMLYELLVGGLPFDSQTLRALDVIGIARLLADEEPPTPSARLVRDALAGMDICAARRTDPKSLIRELRTELEWIPLKAMRKEPNERYQTALALRDDINNYLADRPIRAQKQSLRYSVSRFAKRHRGMVLAWSTIMVLLVVMMSLIGINALLRQNAVQGFESYEARVQRDEYSSHIQSAALAIRENNSRLARHHLDSCPADLRGWEWDYLESRTDQSLFSMGSRGSTVRDAVWSKDGTLIAVCSSDGLSVIDARNGETVRSWAIPDAGSALAAFSLDAKQIVATSRRMPTTLDHLQACYPRVFDLQSGSQVSVLPTVSFDVYHISFTSDGLRVVTANGSGTLGVWDAKSGRLVHEIRYDGVIVTSCVMNYRRDRALLTEISVGGQTLAPLPPRILDLQNGRELLLQDGDLRASVDVGVFSPSDELVATTGGDQKVRIWNSRTGGLQRDLIGHASRVRGLAFSPNDRFVATGSEDGVARIWLTRENRLIATLRGHTASVNSVQFSPDGTRLLTASDDGTARIWNAVTGELITVLMGHTQAVTRADFSPDGSRVLTLSRDNTARVWDTSPHGPTPIHATPLALSASGDLALALASDNTVQLLRTSDGLLVGELKGHAEPVMKADFCVGDDRILTVSQYGDARLWSTSTLEQLDQIVPVQSAALNPRTRQLLWVTPDGQTKCRALDRTAPTTTLDADDVRSAQFSFDGEELLTVSNDNTIKTWDAQTGRQIHAMHSSARIVTALHWSSESWLVACVDSSTDGLVTAVWNLQTHDMVAKLPGPRGMVPRFTVSPDGTTLAINYPPQVVQQSGSSGFGDAQLWDTRTWTQGALLHTSEGIDSLCFAPPQSRVVTGSYSGEVQIWDRDTGKELLCIPVPRPEGSAAVGLDVSMSSDGARLMAGARGHGQVIERTARRQARAFGSNQRSIAPTARETSP